MRFSLLFALLVIGGCGQQDLIAVIAPPADQALATKYIDLLRARQFDEILQVTDPRLEPPLRDALPRMADTLPNREPTSRKLIGAHKLTDDEGLVTNLTFEYGFSDEWFLVNVAWLRKDDSLAIVGFNVYTAPGSLEEMNQFRFAGKSPTHYLVLALAITLPLFTCYALVTCARTPMAGRKWPWILFILFGFGGFALNWTTGEWRVGWLQFQLLSAGVAAVPYGPWILTVSVPLGAVVFLARRRALLATTDEAH